MQPLFPMVPCQAQSDRPGIYLGISDVKSCCGIATLIWLGLAIDEMSTAYAFLAVANAALSAVNLFLYTKNK